MLFRTLLFLLLSFSLLNVSIEAAPLQKNAVRNALGRQAVCNDGSPAIYYLREGSGSGANNWVIFLAGGGFCYSVQSCNERRNEFPELMTSNGKPASLSGPGIFSESPAENPDFYNANHVAIPYCSSDLWSGNREASSFTGGHEFRGWRIVRAVIQDLKKRSGRNLLSAQRVLLSGTSAGGVGAMVHLDWLAVQLPTAIVRGLNDAGWTPEAQLLPFIPGFNQFLDQAVVLWNGRPDVTCAQANPNAKYRCYTSGVFRFLQRPLMVQMSQYDTVMLEAIGVQYPFSATEQALADLFASSVRDSLIPVPAAFSPRTRTHGVLPYRRFYTLKVQGFTLQQLLGNWFFDRPGPVKAVRQ